MSERFARQFLVLGATLALWASWSRPALFALLLAYAAACLLLSWLDAGRLLRAQPPLAVAALALLGVLPGGAALVRAWPDLLQYEGLPVTLASFGDRLRLERTPSIAPGLVSSDEPQTFFVYAPDARQVRVRLAPGVSERGAEALGEGLFRLDYDPRRDGLPTPGEGTVEARLVVDGAGHARALRAVTPLAHPRTLCVSPDGSVAAAVSRETDEVAILSARGLQARIRVGDAPTDCVFVDGSHVVVSHGVDPALWLVDSVARTATPQLAVGARQVGLAISPDRSRLAVARAGRAPEVVLVPLPLAGASVATRFALPEAPDGIAFGPTARELVVATRKDARLRRFVADGAAFRGDGVLALGRPAVTLARSAGGTSLLVATTDYRPDGEAHLGNHFVQDQLLEVDVATMGVRARQLTARRTPRQTRAGDVDSGLSPMGIAQAPGLGLLVAFAGSDELWQLDAPGAEPTRLDLAQYGVHAPHGVAWLADGSRLVCSPVQGLIALFAPAVAAPRILRLAPGDGELRAQAPAAFVRRQGERGFYEGTRSGLSCQSCHLHADTDAAAHNLGDRTLLPTLSVRGLFATAPYLRDGTYGRLRDLHYVSQKLYRGYLRRAPGRAEALEAYVESLARTPSARGASERDPAAERRGVRVFVAAGCTACHAFPAFTNLARQRPAALFPGRPLQHAYEVLDTPSLLSVGASAPYLSDGRAADLRAVLRDHNRANRHGDTARLSARELADLVAFLEAL